MPGLGRIILAALLAEVWQPLRGRDYHALRSLSGGGPGDPPQRKTSVVMRRYACNKRLANDADDRQRKANAAEPSLLAGLLVDARGQRLTPSHAVKKCRRYRYYVSAALITEAGTDRARRPPSCCASC